MRCENSQMLQQEQDLLSYLDDASKGNVSSARDFYILLLQSEIYIPLELNGSDQEAVASTLGNFITINEDSRRLIPVFSSQEALQDWAPFGCPVSKREFKELLYLIADEVWIYFNPGNESGKEFSPWEIELLRRQGIDALDEILKEIDFDRPDDISIKILSDDYAGLKKQLSLILESYPPVTAGFLVGVDGGEEKLSTIALGIKWEGPKGESATRLIDELLVISEERRRDGQEMIIVEDLEASHSPYRRWFDFVPPFYYATVEAKQGKEISSFLKRIFSARR